MNGMNNSWVKKWLMPLTIACCVMALVLVTVPITGVPATVMGGYGGGGGGGTIGLPAGPAVWPFYYVVPPSPVAPAGLYANTFTITILKQYVDVNNIDLSSLAIGGVKPLKTEFTEDGLAVTFDFAALTAGADHITLTGKYKDGREFSVTIPLGR